MNKIVLIVVVGTTTVLPAVFGYNYGQSLSHAYSKGGGGGGGGGYDDHYAPQPYKFGYDIKGDYGGGLYQNEMGDEYGNKKGSYGYTDSYGIYRQVDYIADKHGFRATIKTNEPGTANENPASVYIHSNAPAVDYTSAEGGGYNSAANGYGKKLSSSGSRYGVGGMTAATSYIKSSSPSYSDGSNQIGLYKSASYAIPQYSSAAKTFHPMINRNKASQAAVAASSSSSIYQMPAYYMEPKTVYKNIPYKASASNPVPKTLHLNDKQISQLYGVQMIANLQKDFQRIKNRQKY